MIAEGLKRNEQLKLDFTLFYLETGHRSSRMFRKLAESGMPIERVKRMHVIARVLDLPAILASENVKGYEVAAMKLLGADKPPSAPVAPEVREADADDAAGIMELLNAHQDKVKLTRELINPPTARTLVWESEGEIRGVMAYVTVEHVGKTSVPWAWLNHVAWDGLSLGERIRFAGSFLAIAAEAGHAGVVEWSKHTYPALALYASRFVPYPRRVDMMGWRFRDDMRLSDIREVYEVQI
jgi:hypothetical protein